jgi:hypothetical protein
MKKPTSIIHYKGYQIENYDTDFGSSLIYKDGELSGCTHSDEGKNNSELKAKYRIDTNQLRGLVKYNF